MEDTPMSNWGPGSPERDVSGRESNFSFSESQSSDGDEDAIERQVSGVDEDNSDESDMGGSVYDVMRPGEYGFLPVLGFNESGIAIRRHKGAEGDEELLTIGGKELTWWEDNSIMPRHNFVLVNPLEHQTERMGAGELREVFRMRKGEHFIFADSGGYQLVMTPDARVVDDASKHSWRGHDIHPETLLEWQVKNADAGSTIDFPPYVSTGGNAMFDSVDSISDAIETEDGVVSWEEFFKMRAGEARDMTYRKAKRLKEMRESGDEDALDYIYAPVIQARPHPSETHELVRYWHGEMKDASEGAGVTPRGWTFSPKPSQSFGQIAMFLAYAANYMEDADYLHVLMVGGLLQKCLIMYYAMNSEHFVTSDASSHASGGKRRQFYLPKTATRRSVIISSRDEDDDDAALNPTKLDRYPCKCSVCSTIERHKGYDFIKTGSGNVRSASLNLHNLQQLLNIERTLDALLREEDVQIVETGGEPKGCEFWRYVSTIAQDKSVADLYRAMDYVRISIEEDLETANEKYRIKWKKSNGKTIDRGTGSAGGVSW